jgi:hypothetical protein
VFQRFLDLGRRVYVTISHEVTVVGGVFAPANLGELAQYPPLELVDDVPADPGPPLQGRSTESDPV